MQETRPAAVAGIFYPAEPGELRQTVERLLQEAGEPRHTDPKALVVPHAGYAYSGSLAARAYRGLVDPHRIRRVVILGPAHRVPVLGMALPSVNRFATPLGEVALDREAMERIRELPEVKTFDAAHAMEHALEVHLPFLQVLLDDFEIVPLVVGDTGTSEVVEVLDRLWGGPETLVVVSSDLSHFHPEQEARALDGATAEAIEACRSADIDTEQACGRVPLRGLLEVARRRGMTVERLGLCNSADAAGPRDHVVGYGAWSFH